MELSPQKNSQLAAAFTISNMGQKVPEDISSSGCWSSTPQSAICNLAGHLMETDEHERIFVKEAAYWSEYVREKSREELVSVHGVHSPWLEAIMDAPDDQIK